LPFEDLPTGVRNKFISTYNYKESPRVNADGDTLLYSPPFVECYNLKSKYACNVESKGGVIRNLFFEFESGNKKNQNILVYPTKSICY